MCGLCGILGSSHWSEAAPTPASDEARPRRKRWGRVRLVNAVLDGFALRLDDFQGQAYLLSNRTGRTEVVPDLMGVWTVGAAMAGRPLDPLDDALLDRLEARLQAPGPGVGGDD